MTNTILYRFEFVCRRRFSRITNAGLFLYAVNNQLRSSYLNKNKNKRVPWVFQNSCGMGDTQCGMADTQCGMADTQFVLSNLQIHILLAWDALQRGKCSQILLEDYTSSREVLCPGGFFFSKS